MVSQINHLQAEIEFWREMIESQTREGSPQAVERMKMALALAEKRYQQFFGDSQAGSETKGLLQGTDSIHSGHGVN